jgi:uncharacterized protein YdhG (YjbR/CyaY superfamily)
MKSKQTAPQTIDDYIAAFSPDIQQKLKKMRATIKKAAPGADEAIKYGLATFVLGRNLVHFGAFKNHIGFYATSSGHRQFQNELSAYKGSKGSVQFPLDKPIPFGLITRIVKFRVKENLAALKTKRSHR